MQEIMPDSMPCCQSQTVWRVRRARAAIARFIADGDVAAAQAALAQACVDAGACK